ncbi:hypothetical protein DFH11DRAFT_1520409 [Phellopilus nigrolimitatus]|nr:hypothetical protein DFH11DRAFT_1520409 [Phellopilus nigrolimitatus]
MRGDTTSYVPHRTGIYALLWLFALAELGLTGYRIHHTRSLAGVYDPIVAELLVTALLTLLWIPFTILFHHRGAGTRAGDGGAANTGAGAGAGARPGFSLLHGETFLNLVLWLMWLIGGAIATNKWPNSLQTPPGKQGHVLRAIVALAWIAFGLLTLAKALAAMEYAALRARGAGAGVGAAGVGEKGVAGAPAAGPGVNGAGPGVNGAGAV